jgi:Ni,Fe-hydrogenase I cytochrome b subunit
MTIIEPSNKDVQHPDQHKGYSSALRFWHWANAIIITGSLLTVLINNTILKRTNTIPLIRKALQDKGLSVTADQARNVGHELSDQVWGLHTWFGYFLAGFLLFRLFLEFFQFADQKLIRKIKSGYQQFFVIKKNREVALHEFTVKTVYAVFYLLLLVMAVTGLCLAFEDDVPFIRSLGRTPRNIHGFTMYLILAFIAVHLIGVFLAERRDGKGIVSDMINGGDKKDLYGNPS